MSKFHVPEVVGLGQLIETYLHGDQLVSYTSRYLTKPGDNYGSIMLSITGNVKRSDGVIEEFPLIAKLPPITNQVYWNIFQPQRTCITENAVYLKLAPGLFKLQNELNINMTNSFDCFAKCYGARISLIPNSSIVDRNAVLLLENLQTQGYKAGNHNKMFDYHHMHLILQNMAKFHGLSIALRHRNKTFFNTEIKPYFKRFNINASLDLKVLKALQEQNLKEVEMAMNKNEDIVQRVSELFSLNEKFVQLKEECADGIWTTVAHCDMWINNIMIQYDESMSPINVKFVDFQVAQYESLAHDLIFFLLSSGDTTLLERHFNEFLECYYESLMNCLKSMGCPVNEYSFEKLMLEVKRVMPIEIPHALSMVKFILVDSHLMPEDFKDLQLEAFTSSDVSERVVGKIADIVRLSQKFGYI